ncbi:inositol monophosphatase family protein [Salinibacterium hongtaonis]|uniref:Inositol-1-monophosphatase n=1 Tax=Homoserinimonas hongtaonis TaxID=2079791 RepID=A0A2U1T2H2_9MICO|nr:inositol monophosphatase family protein [Salinibacterium hongtaonis]PWB98066.1 inositol monophosphatase [Salinibacterium hongtaonis]
MTSADLPAGPPHPDALLSIAVDIALRAGEIAKTRRREGVAVAASKSSAVDVVTFADREVEAFIRDEIAQARPDDGFFGEESDAAASSSGLTWVVDPIDGTVNYLYGIPNYAVSIAVVAGEPNPLTWKALAGVVVSPESGEVFTATTGGGARLNGEEIRANRGVQPDRALVGTGFGYDSEVRLRQVRMLEPLLREVRDIRRMGAASLDLCSVACGRLDAYFERGLQPWDHAAGALIARESGARVVGMNGAAASAQMTIAGDELLTNYLERYLLKHDLSWEV